jgi:predicted metal-binding membrane protein
VRPSIVITPAVRPPRKAFIGSAVRAPRSPVLVAAIAGAWIIAVVAEATGQGALLHHHALIQDGPPLWVALALFLVAWQVMIAAMMLPASLPAIRAFEAVSRALRRPGLAMASFLAAYAVVWTVFGQLAFMGDVVLHHVVDATPWLGTRPWLIEAGILALGGAYQFAPNKRRGLEACCHPAGLATTIRVSGSGAFRLGLEHGFDCLGSAWALMLVMFAAGFANLWWMVALTGVMAYETMGRHGQRAAPVAGVVLVLLALLVASSSSWAMSPMPGLMWR